MRRTLLLLLFLCLSLSAHAQVFQGTQVGVPPAAEVQRLAPQLVPFAGGEVNFQNLVNGLALGLPVTLTTPLPGGLLEVVSFTPAGTLTPLQIAQTLENARQVAIANGIAAPTAQQLGVILNGGSLPTALGTTPVNGLIAGSGPLNASVAGATASPAQVLQQTPRFSRSDSPLPRGIADTPIRPPGAGVAGAAPAPGAGFGAPPAPSADALRGPATAPAAAAPAATPRRGLGDR
ncbi:MAG TPA: hypothetical protein VF211_04235 [Burkholderiales bacterium]